MADDNQNGDQDKQKNASSSGGIPPPPPLPPHPKQVQMIDHLESVQPINPPRIKFKDSFTQNLQSSDSLLNTSPVSKLNLTHDRSQHRNKNDHLEKVSSNEKTNQNSLSSQQQENNENRSANEIPTCCYAPPCLNYINGCKEIKKNVNYGKRVQITEPAPCNHYLIGNNGCEKCCKLITINRNIFSLHCAWHHQPLTCFVCKASISDLDHRVYRGKVYCEDCFLRAKQLHGSEMKTVHKRRQ